MYRFPIMLAALLGTALHANAEPNVVVSIKPVHALVSAVMKDVGVPKLLVDGANSPHTFNLKPSDAKALADADAVVWVGEELEAFMQKNISSLADKSAVITLLKINGLKTLPARENVIFEVESDEHDDHADGDHSVDAHVWLDPDNAKLIANSVAQELSRLDPANAKTYETNLSSLNQELDQLTQDIATSLKNTSSRFVVFHDAYQYFEKRFDVASLGALSIHPENPPGAKAIADIHKLITDSNIACVFAEPQFDQKLITVVTENTSAKPGVLDPLGANLEPGPGLYTTLLRNLADGIARC